VTWRRRAELGARLPQPARLGFHAPVGPSSVASADPPASRSALDPILAIVRAVLSMKPTRPNAWPSLAAPPPATRRSTAARALALPPRPERSRVWTHTPARIVELANDRCDQENVIGQLKSGINALHAPVNDLHSNWAYMLIASLAWNTKSWHAMMMHRKHDRRTFIRMEFNRPIASANSRTVRVIPAAAWPGWSASSRIQVDSSLVAALGRTIDGCWY
jgi:hypothetical protein